MTFSILVVLFLFLLLYLPSLWLLLFPLVNHSFPVAHSLSRVLVFPIVVSQVLVLEALLIQVSLLVWMVNPNPNYLRPDSSLSVCLFEMAVCENPSLDCPLLG
ncbi:hypothetical protein ASPVEDRAFT_44544 [Aspergillus versicolor CBS 583.65]|uniref:Uncharacterized protein n=1 Tax=Aspergillus versicolor CBS 583.65 TaxID=1036611 RepID=A0A1L9PUA1_ASPVE|nr:uncharacterized protein ASPVEDRAFT_44544 [Aspergillus versicolor CBS 583.65]OJJ05005.1 hypothetical protein ASPVEDRAFT_44544 [Aspergillus versicolor CBS 583.65]